MEYPYFKYLKSNFNISKETYLTLENLALKRHLTAGENIVEQGKKSNKVAVLTSGLMRAYCILESGKEITKNIFTPVSFLGSLSSILKNEPSYLCYEALVDSELYVVNANEFIKMSKTNINVSNFYNRVLESIYLMYERKQLDIMVLNGTQRYLFLKKQIPNIDNGYILKYG